MNPVPLLPSPQGGESMPYQFSETPRAVGLTL